MSDFNKSSSSLGSLAVSALNFPTENTGKGPCLSSPGSNRGRRIQLIKMVSLTLVPILGLWVFCAYQLTDDVRTKQDREKSLESLSFSIDVGKLVHHLQNERDLSILFLSALGPDTKSFLFHEYSVTDNFIESLNAWPGNLDRFARKEFRTKTDMLTHLARHRQNLDGSSIDKEYRFYSSIIDIVVLWGYQSINESKFSILWKSFVAYQKITMAKENLGVERAFGTMFFSQGGFETHEQFEIYNINSFGFQENFKSARMYSSTVDYLESYQDRSVGVNTSKALNEFRYYVKAFGENERDPTKIDLLKARWHYDNVTKYLDTLLNLQSTLGYICKEKLTELIKKSKTDVIINSCLLVVVLLACTFVIFGIENLTSSIQKYAGILVDRTKELTVEKKRTDSLLYQMIPKSVAKKLKRNDSISAEYFNSVTVFFSDIEGFSQISLSLPPLRLVELLNCLYGAIDDLVGQRNLYKVETINDSYMIVSGLPKRNNDLHASEIAHFALALLHLIKTKTFLEFGKRHIQLRIGINSGPCMAGIVGSKLPRYCLFGDTINVASRMKSNGLPNQIHISHSTYTLLAKTGKFSMMKRGNITIKGKGEMATYWLKDDIRSPFGSSDAHSHVSLLSSSSFAMVCDMFQDGGALMQALGMNQEFSHKSQSASDLRTLAPCPIKTAKPVSVSVSDESLPDFNTLRNLIGRRKTEICIDEMADREKTTNESNSLSEV